MTMAHPHTRLGAVGKHNQAPRGACFKAALDALFGGDCPRGCNGIRERFRSCNHCPQISNPQLISAFADLGVPDEALLDTQALPAAVPEHTPSTRRPCRWRRERRQGTNMSAFA